MPQFTLQDKLALMMTSARSQRTLATYIGGVTHQQVGRWLSIGQTTPTGEPSRVRPPTDPDLLARIDQAFAMHVEVSRDQAKVEHIPFTPRAPVYAARRVYKDGSIGQMIDIWSTHRLSNALRAELITDAHRRKPDFYYTITVQSTVSQVPYWWKTEGQLNLKRTMRDNETLAYRTHLAPTNEQEDEYSAGRLIPLLKVNTKRTGMSNSFPITAILADIDKKLESRHSPAVGDKGTALATRISLQTNSKSDSYGVRNEDENRRKAIAKRQRKHRAKSKGKILR